MKQFFVLTLFPEMIEQTLSHSIMGRAQKEGHISVEAVNIRDFTQNKHRHVDDYPYGGGCGMVLYAQPIADCLRAVQREVAVRIAEKPGTKDYGILSVFLQAFYDIEYLFTVGEGVFNPPPKVKSAVIRLTRNGVERLGCDEVLFARVVKAVFNQRRKTIRNSLHAAFGDLRGEEHDYFSLRPEVLSVKQFEEMTRWVGERIAEKT